MKQVMKWLLPLLVVTLAGCASSSHKGGLPEGPVAPVVTTQAYNGNLPCRHCSRIETRLVLNGLNSTNAKDHTFIMDAKYIAHEGAQGGRRYTGSWDRLQGTPADPSAEVINLLDQQTDPQTMFHFQQIDDKTLEMIDGQLQRYENGRGLRLYLEPANASWREQGTTS